ncbi:MAG: nucleoside triphosphate pyrophosphohydrolase [Gammaproteobacteria bacterium]|nr:nucleoside triphosphate pyrophosphohydrolase [Gammaproteobacteria bacterium]
MRSIERLLEVMQTLRDPQDGCPWDLQQNFSTIAPYTIEEAYEVADAIAREDLDGLRDELGDLLFQIVFHARMAEEAQAFDFNDVASGISDKMIRRHPHVFGSDEQRQDGQQDGSWEQIKAAERSTDADDSVLAGVALALPALKRAQKLGKRAATVGFDWPERQGVREKIHEELEELEEAVGERDQCQMEEEFGDLLFAVVNLARHLDIDPEKALSGANHKFEKRFREMERVVVDGGKSLKRLSLAVLNQEWRAAKKRLS